MKKVLYPILAVFVFMMMQALAGAGIVALLLIANPDLIHQIRTGGAEDMLNNHPNAIAWTVVISGAATIAIISLLKMIEWRQVLNFKSMEWKWGTVAIVASILGIFALGIVEEMIELPNLMEEQFLAMSNSWVGLLCIGVLGPIIEEFIFRESILGYMLRGGMNKWVAITASALLFGIIHLNPAQIPFAATMGFILGIIYYKTGNIVITCILHILNNSVAVWQMYTLGEKAKDFSMVEQLGGTTPAILYAVVCLAVCILLLVNFWKKYKQTNINYETVS